MPTEGAVLAYTVEKTREYTQYYLRKLVEGIPDQAAFHRRFVREGHELNSAYWLIAHIAVTQNGLLLMSTGGPFEKFSWAKYFGRGGAGLPPDQCPPLNELLDTFERIHSKAVAHIAALPDEALDGPNVTGIAMIGTTVRDVIIHGIRHEALHTGHLSWVCKLHGIATM
ncbi:MAG: DinB family protein [Flavobacteriales bacterium]|nr:DinB family protein [Flavobacteriales bacterium]